MEVAVQIKPDSEGYVGRECPECERYFKVKPGTGLTDINHVHCPYCNCTKDPNHFWTKQQIEYAHSVALRQFTGAFLKDLKKLERKPNKNSFLSIGISVKGQPTPLIHYSEKELEEKITCNQCTLEYAIYGSFGYCPDCGAHNSLQILEANFDLILKILNLSSSAANDIAAKLIENSLEDAVSAFDGYARTHCEKLYKKISFQNLQSARNKLLTEHGFDLSDGLSENDWKFAIEQFEKRHLLAHKMGIIDEDFINKTNLPHMLIGRKVSISVADINKLIDILKVTSNNLATKIKRS